MRFFFVLVYILHMRLWGGSSRSSEHGILMGLAEKSTEMNQN